MAIISHDTDLMRDWSGDMEGKSNEYDTLVSRLYSIIDSFVGSPEFSGGLSADFHENVVSKRPEFQKYSDTFRECAELIKNTASSIDSDEAELKSMINRSNPL